MDMATRLKLAELIQKDMDQLRQKADGAFACNAQTCTPQPLPALRRLLRCPKPAAPALNLPI